MSTKNQYEDRGLMHKGSCYTTLNKSWKYSCPHKNTDYSGFSNGVNCLCVGTHTERSSWDTSVVLKKKWPMSNDKLGWK